MLAVWRNITGGGSDDEMQSESKSTDEGAAEKVEHLPPLSIMNEKQIGDDPALMCVL